MLNLISHNSHAENLKIGVFMKLVFMFLMMTMTMMLGSFAIAQEAGGLSPEVAANAILNFLIPFIAQYPVVSTIFMVIGGLRLFLKPFMAVFKAIVEYTPYDSDDKVFSKVESSKAYKAVCFVLDLLGSVKLPKK